MFFGKIERDLLDGELWLVSQQTKLPEHLQLLVDKEQSKRDDIWQLRSDNKVKKAINYSRD
ncbi:hypothetical protein NIES4075_64310 [Tolypothrix sp. NIES-4075]|uniref:hypothetical protein n=1 Tax=Tolypothrix sp. NIES-4075 TaxID=2005459 RepID=UPI000B5C40A9|nr:hypothetical protein [Tolypothrix sp. NIES-4075]GAX45410.1 hypothetical protein NIES4075_64310 [Tolypothrix sp. NIES-4075]